MLPNKIGTKSYILVELFGPTCPLVEGYALVVNWIDTNIERSRYHVQSMSLYISLAYGISRVEAAYCNIHIRAVMMTILGESGA